MTFFSSLPDQFGDFEFAGDFGLTEAASGDLHTIFGFLVSKSNAISILATFVFVVPPRCDGPSRAAGRAGFAGMIKEVKTVGAVVGIRFFRGV